MRQSSSKKNWLFKIYWRCIVCKITRAMFITFRDNSINRQKNMRIFSLRRTLFRRKHVQERRQNADYAYSGFARIWRDIREFVEHANIAPDSRL